MKKQLGFMATFVFMFLSLTFWVTAEVSGNNPVAVSPGSETGVVTVWQSCPTFSWSSVNQAASYRIAVFASADGKITSYEGMTAMSAPVISKLIPGPALSWTLSSEESLKTGGMYAWYVQAVDASGNAVGLWSNGKVFRVEQEVRFAGIEEKLAGKLREYGVNEETITNVLSDMKSEVKEVVVRNAVLTTAKKKLDDTGVVQGTEGVNTLYGVDAGASITTGNGDTFIGRMAGHNNTTGFFNTFLGHSAGSHNTTGFQNTFIGNYAGPCNTTGNFNTFLGHSAGYTNDTGKYNTFIGHYAGGSNTIGYYNTFLGHYAGYTNNTGYYNAFLGSYAGYANTTGYCNTFIGNYAGLFNTTGSYNTFIGCRAGFDNKTGLGNVFLGYNAGYNETGSNKLYIANSSTPPPLIYGEFDNKIVTINGKLGVGVYPSHLIHLSGGAYSDGCTWTDCSSRVLKENIQSLGTEEALNTLSNLNPVKFNYKANKADKHVGFIAEDVPELVATGDRKGLSPMDITAVLTKVVQELRRENQEYKKIISDLQERMAKLEKE